MGTSLAAGLLWLTLAFSSTFACQVEGYLYRMGDEVAFTRLDGCHLVRHAIRENSLHLSGPHWWVVIVLPVTHGQVRLVYRWGAEAAYLGKDRWPIAWGRILPS